jgi:hypothetical protein
MNKWTCLLSIGTLLLASCAGTPFSWSEARQVRVGMTSEQVTRLMGHPYTVSSGQEGDEQWAWSYGTGLGTGGYYKITLKNNHVTDVPNIPASLR